MEKSKEGKKKIEDSYSIESSSLLISNEQKKKKNQKHPWRNHLFLLFTGILTVVVGGGGGVGRYWRHREGNDGSVVHSEKGVVAADDGRCSEVGAAVLRKGGHAVDAAVAVAFCLGVVNPSSSGIGGGGFMVVWSSASSSAQVFNMRESAPAAASQNMYEKIPDSKSSGAMSVGVPGELAGLHEAWKTHGRLPWRDLVGPAIKLANHGFSLSTFLGVRLKSYRDVIMADLGLRGVFAPGGDLVQVGDTCFNPELGRTLQMVAKEGADALYNGTLGERLVRDVTNSGGILTMDDLNNYRIHVTKAVSFDVMGYTVLGMPLPSSGTLGLSLVLNILNSYDSPNAATGPLGLHRLIEALKHMFAIRMNLGDPQFVDNTEFESKMLSRSFARKIRSKIDDNRTFDSDYYLNKWGQLSDKGTSHFCVVDAERNAVSMTSSVNYPFGSGILSPSVGIVLNNEMDDFSVPTDPSPGNLPPSPANFIEPNKRPLSSMSPIIILKEKEVVGVVGASGGMKIIPAIAQVLINHFVLGLDPLAAVESPRIHTKLVPNEVEYENCTVLGGDHTGLSEENISFLEERGHRLKSVAVALSVCQLVVQVAENPVDMGRREGKPTRPPRRVLVAVSDPRKGGRPAAM